MIGDFLVDDGGVPVYMCIPPVPLLRCSPFLSDGVGKFSECHGQRP